AGCVRDCKKDVALLAQAPFLEVDLLKITPHASPHLDRIDRRCPAGEVGVVGHVPFDRTADRDGCGRRHWRSRGRASAAGDADTEPKKENAHHEVIATL